jgi:hypothetical protein
VIAFTGEGPSLRRCFCKSCRDYVDGDEALFVLLNFKLYFLSLNQRTITGHSNRAVVAKNSFGVACVNDESVPPGAVKPLASAFLANVFHFPVTPFVFDFAAVLPRHAFHRCDWFVANVSAGNGAELFEEPGSVLDTERGGDALLLAGGEVGAASESSGELRFGHAGGGDFVILTASGLDFPA